MDKNKDIIIKKIAEYFFNQWKEKKIEEGYHLPQFCPYYEKKEMNEEIIDDDIIHCNKCLISLSSFSELEDFFKKEYFEKAESLYNNFLKIGLKIIIE